MAKIFLLIGPVGAGKSTFALQLGKDENAVCLNLDDWMTELFSDDRPEIGVIEWYVERTQRCIEQIWKVAQRLIQADTNVVLEIGLIQRRERKAFYERVNDKNIELMVYVLDTPREVRRKRVAQRNLSKGETFSMVVPADIFELASDIWEPPSKDECTDHNVNFIFIEE